MAQNKGLMALWAGVIAIVVGASTFGVLVLTHGGPRPQAARVSPTVEADALDSVVGDEPTDEGTSTSTDEDAEDGAKQGATDEDEPAVVPPEDATSVLAPGVGLYTVKDFALIEFFDISSRVGAGDVLVSDGKYQVILGPELIPAADVYEVEVTNEEASEGEKGGEATEASWTVSTRFVDATKLATASADLGCNENPDNMIALVAGSELLRLGSLPDTYCGEGFTRGQILWLNYYGDDVSTEDAEASARVLEAKLLGTEAG